jgi:hypothetical protein
LDQFGGRIEALIKNLACIIFLYKSQRAELWRQVMKAEQLCEFIKNYFEALLAKTWSDLDRCVKFRKI